MPEPHNSAIIARRRLLGALAAAPVAAAWPAPAAVQRQSPDERIELLIQQAIMLDPSEFPPLVRYGIVGALMKAADDADTAPLDGMLRILRVQADHEAAAERPALAPTREGVAI